jgi:seryl-tRNA synthetase
MLTLQQIREQREDIVLRLNKRMSKEDLALKIDQIISIDDQRKALQAENDTLLAQVNILSKEIGDLYKSGQAALAHSKKEEVATLKEHIAKIDTSHKQIIDDLENLLITVPNAPHHSVPAGSSADDNEILKNWDKELPKLYSGAIPHWELASKYNLIDFETGTKITGSGFPLYRGKGAKLQRALISFFLDQASEAGFEEVMPPFLVNPETARATGQLPDKEGQMYHCEKDDLYLIPTAEVPVTNIYRDVILNESDLPIKLTGYTPCFRREAGSYGADVKGLNRLHQFDKVEIVEIAHPDESYKVLEEMVAHVGGLLDKLELPYRILRLCGGDMGFTSALTYDFEVYSAAQERWLEVSSVSNFETFQSNRLKLRYRDEDGKKHLAHTLNGSALALARIVAALLENHQTAEGIVIPSALRTYTKFDIIN